MATLPCLLSLSNLMGKDSHFAWCLKTSNTYLLLQERKKCIGTMPGLQKFPQGSVVPILFHCESCAISSEFDTMSNYVSENTDCKKLQLSDTACLQQGLCCGAAMALIPALMSLPLRHMHKAYRNWPWQSFLWAWSKRPLQGGWAEREDQYL